MKIVIDARPIADHFPGIGRYIYNLIIGLTEQAHPHTLALLHCPALRNTRHDMAAFSRISGIEIIATDAQPFTLAEQIQIPRLLRQLRADLYHATYYIRPYTRLPCPSVVTLYDTIPRLFPAEVSVRARLLFDILTRLAIHASNRIITISASARADISSAYGIPAHQIAVTPLAPAPQFHPQSPDAIASIRAKYNLPEHYVLSLASSKPHKNLVQLINAWQLYKQADHQNIPCLVLAGHHDPRYPQARELVATHNLEPHVRFLPSIAEADLPAIYAGAAIFVFPSLYEGFGLPPLEAMACGIPVICGTTSSLPEVVGEAALQIDTRDPGAIAEAIRLLLRNEQLREELRSASLQRAAEFSWKKTAMQTLAVYEHILKNRTGTVTSLSQSKNTPHE